MLRIAGLLIALLALSQETFSSPLLFSATKQVTENKPTIIGTFDASKYSEIRVAALVSDSNWSTCLLDATPQTHIAAAVCPGVQVTGVEKGDEVDLGSLFFRRVQSASMLVGVPPSTVRFMSSGTGTFTVYVWGR